MGDRIWYGISPRDAPVRMAAAHDTMNPSGLTSSHDAVNTFHTYGMVRPGTSATCATNSVDDAPQRNMARRTAMEARVAWGTFTRSMKFCMRVAPSAVPAGGVGGLRMGSISEMGRRPCVPRVASERPTFFCKKVESRR